MPRKKTMTVGAIADIEPHYEELLALYENYRHTKTKRKIFELWAKQILPETPKITVEQWINHTRYLNSSLREKEMRRIQREGTRNMIAKTTEASAITLVKMEDKMKQLGMSLLDEANYIMEEAKNDPSIDTDAKYFALGVMDKLWGRIQKEKELALKSAAEKRHAVTAFAQLMRGAVSGELTFRDIELMRQKNQSAPTIKENTEEYAE